MSVNAMAPAIRPPRVSLLSSAEVISPPRGGRTDDGNKWQGGIEIYPLSATDASGTWIICGSGQSKDATNRIGGQSFQPFAIYATDNCSTFGSGSVDFGERARAKLAVVEPYWLERVLWENPDGLANPSFVGSPATTVTTGADPIGAFSQLDSAVADDLHDGRGMIHMTTRMFDLLVQYDVFRREGNVWFSPLDNIVVPGRGYTGNGPNPDGGANENAATSTVEWMFGHPGIVQIIRGSVTTLGEPDSEMDRAVNDIWVTAEKAVGFIVTNGLGDDEGAAVTGFYAASADMSLASGAGGGGSSALAVATPVVVDETSYPTATKYLGYSLYNDSGADAEVRIYNGSDNTGAILDIVSLVDGESAREWYDPGMVVNGIFVDVTVGAINAGSTIRYVV